MSNSDSRKAEALSALMDGDIDELSVRRTLRDIDDNDALRERWHRYHLASAAMHKELSGSVTDLSGAISQAIDAEKHSASRAQRWVHPLGRFAVAASVTLVAVLGIQQYQQPDNSLATAESQPAFSEAQPLPSTFQMPQLPIRTVSAVGDSRERSRPVEIRQTISDQETHDHVQHYLNGLMLRHTENAALNTNQGMMPFARMPNTQTEQR